jgi:molecular chaperone HtpG
MSKAAKPRAKSKPESVAPVDGKPQAFQAEVAKLLHLMVHSVYSDRDVFLRELISNASDALDKLRYEAIAAPELLEKDANLNITITVDKKAATLTLADTGIGMTADELADNLGTIAKSGTQAFMQKTTNAPELIGQFTRSQLPKGFPAAQALFFISRKMPMTFWKPGKSNRSSRPTRITLPIPSCWQVKTRQSARSIPPAPSGCAASRM